jgi:hypothetical protein
MLRDAHDSSMFSGFATQSLEGEEDFEATMREASVPDTTLISGE